MSASRWTAICLAVAGAFVAALALLWLAVPRDEDGIELTGQLVERGWMAWTFPVALFFLAIAALLALMTILAIRYPEAPRRGVLRIETTRGDRLFVSLLGSAFINLAWLYFLGPPLWGALALCLVYAAAVFRWV